MRAALSVVSFVLAAVAYWRSGGKRDAKKLRHEVDVLRAKQREFMESAAQDIAATYEKCRQRLETTRTRLRHMKDQAGAELQNRVKRLEEHIEHLGARVQGTARSAKYATVGATKNLQESIVRRVHRIEARAGLVEAWGKAQKAVIAADKNRFDDAEQLLEDASELLGNARRILSEDQTYDERLEATKKALRTATLAVQNRAADSGQKIEEVMRETDRVVCDLESDENKAEQTRLPTESSKSPKQSTYEKSDYSRQAPAAR